MRRVVFSAPSGAAWDDGSSTTASHSSRLGYHDPDAHRLPVPDWSHIETARTRFNVLAGVGVFGAGLSYSTFYTAKPTEAPPSLTLMSWAYTAFLSCTLVSIVWQIVLTSGFPAPTGGIAYRSRAGIWSAVATAAISAYAGTVLLTLALTTHTARAIAAAAYTIVGASVVLVASSATRYYLTIRKTGRLSGQSPGFLHTMVTQQMAVVRPAPIRASSLRPGAPDPPAPTINGHSAAPDPSRAVDPDDAAASFFIQAYDAYGGALQYLVRRCPGWQSIDTARQAQILIDAIECFCFDSGSYWLNSEHGYSDFEEFARQAPRWTTAVEDLYNARQSVSERDYRPAYIGPLGRVRADQVLRLTEIFEGVERMTREGRDKAAQASGDDTVTELEYGPLP